jgi:hypothetical protein
VTWYRPVVDRRRPFSDRHGFGNLAVDGRLLSVMPPPTHAARAPQVLQQFLLQGASGLDEQAAVDRFV